MADITFGGLATGLPTDDIVTQLMEIERRPIDRLEAKKEAESLRLQAFKQLNTRLEDLRASAGDMNITSEVLVSNIQLSSDNNFTATSAGASSGSYDVTVVQLAQVQKSVAAGVASQTDSLFGTGTLTLGDEVISIDDSNNSLLGLKAAINAVSESTGVSASIINDGTEDAPYRLVLTGQDATTSFTPEFDLVDEDEEGTPFTIPLIMTEASTAQQAIAYVDGIKIVRDSNTLTGVISGVTMNLTQASTQLSAGVEEVDKDPSEWAVPPVYETTQMTVTPDTETLKGKITNFVDSYNGMMDWISAGYAEFGASAPTEQEIEDGAEDILSDVLRGNSTVNTIKRQMQSMLSSVIDNSGSFSTLSQLGITTQRDGSLGLNETKLDDALENNFADVGKLLAGEDETDGVMKKFNSALMDITSSTGMYAAKKSSYDAAAVRIDRDLVLMEMLVTKKEETMRAKFSAMEELVSGMNSQSSFLTQQMDMLNNMIIGNK